MGGDSQILFYFHCLCNEIIKHRGASHSGLFAGGRQDILTYFVTLCHLHHTLGQVQPCRLVSYTKPNPDAGISNALASVGATGYNLGQGNSQSNTDSNAECLSTGKSCILSPSVLRRCSVLLPSFCSGGDEVRLSSTAMSPQRSPCTHQHATWAPSKVLSTSCPVRVCATLPRDTVTEVRSLCVFWSISCSR